MDKAVGGVETDEDVEEKVRARGNEDLAGVAELVDDARLAFDAVFLRTPGRGGSDLSLFRYAVLRWLFSVFTTCAGR